MFNFGNEKKSMKRGSFFITSPDMNANRSKPKKTIFSSSNDDISKFHFHRHRETTVGDSNENISKLNSDWTVNESGNVEVKMSKTVLVDKKNLKYPGHFSNLKKKNQEEFNKFLESKSKNIEIIQMKATIEKIQSKIRELSKEIELRLQPRGQHEDSARIISVASPSKNIVEDLRQDFKFKWNDRKMREAIGLVSAIAVFILVVLYFIEGKFFFSSVLLPLKPNQSKSWFK